MQDYLIHLPDRAPVRVRTSAEGLRIGRAPDQDLVLDEAVISRNHALLFWRGERLFLKDLGSTHGTFVNGARLAEEHPIASGDRVRMGITELLFEAVRPDPAAVRPLGSEDTLVLPVDKLRGWLKSDPSRESFPSWREALDLLHEVSLKMSMDLTSEQFLVDLLERLFQFLDASRGAVLLRKERGDLTLLASRTQEHASTGPLNLAPATVEAALERREALLLKESPALETRLQEAEATTTSSMMAVPLEHNGEVLGLFYFDASPARLPFTETDLRFVASLGSLAAAKLLQQRLADSLKQTQKLQSLGSLAGGVAHDMNNVLGAILNLATLHQAQAPAGSLLKQSMETIAKACERGAALVKGLLGFARQDLAVSKVLDLNVLVRETVALLERTTLQKVRLGMDLARDLRPVKGDPAALSHALMNLCVNAVDAMPDGGQLTLQTRNEGSGAILLEVIDTGSGMPKDVLEKALDPFFTTKPQGKGTGLGLSIVYGTVKAHHGEIWLESAPGQGTTVAIQLPACEELLEASPEAGPSCSVARGKRVLVVDDDDLIQESTAALLESLGHMPFIAGDGREALRMLEEGLAVDVVLLDLNMPGMGGAQALPLIRALRPELPVLLATGRADAQALELVRAIPLVSLLAKPYGMKVLGEALG